MKVYTYRNEVGGLKILSKKLFSYLKLNDNFFYRTLLSNAMLISKEVTFYQTEEKRLRHTFLSDVLVSLFLSNQPTFSFLKNLK